MKMFKRLSVILAMAGVMMAGNVMAKNLSAEKQAKMKLKTLKGWTIEGTAKAPIVAMTKFIEKTDDEDKYVEKVLTSQCETSVSVNVCRQTALNRAMTEYAKQMSSYIRDRFTGHHVNEKGNSSERDQEAYDAYSEKVLKGALEFKFGFYKENKDGTRVYQAFCIIDKEKARKAVDEVEEMKDYADEINGYLNDFFKQ